MVCSNVPCTKEWTNMFELVEVDVHVTVHRDKFLIVEPTRCTNLSKFYFGIKLHMFRTVPLSIIRSFSLCTQQWYVSYRFADSLWAGSVWNCPKHVEFHSKIKFWQISSSGWFCYKKISWSSNSIVDSGILYVWKEVIRVHCFWWW
jgi:hypothetical protein